MPVTVLPSKCKHSSPWGWRQLALLTLLSLQHVTTASCCTTLISDLFTSAFPYDHVRGIMCEPSFSPQGLEARAPEPSPRNCTQWCLLLTQNVFVLNLSHVQNCTQVITALPWVFSIKPAKCEVDGEERFLRYVNNGLTDRGSLLYSLIVSNILKP